MLQFLRGLSSSWFKQADWFGRFWLYLGFLLSWNSITFSWSNRHILFRMVHTVCSIEHGGCSIIYSRSAPWIASFLDNTDKRDDPWWIGSQVFWITDDHPVWIFEIFKNSMCPRILILFHFKTLKNIWTEREIEHFSKTRFMPKIAIDDLSMTNNGPKWPEMTLKWLIE